MKILDVAAGTGCVALAAAQVPGVAEVHACDLSTGMLAELSAAAATLPHSSASIATTPCDATALPFAADTFRRGALERWRHLRRRRRGWAVGDDPSDPARRTSGLHKVGADTSLQ